jgi:16S rRNA (cytosine967-C5)-methyltransferase
MKISPSRAAAFDVLMRIERDKAFSSVLLPIAEESLSPADRSLCHELVLGTLRKQLYLDRLISMKAPGRKLDPAVVVALRLAIYQIKFLDRIPHHSAVNESVNLVHRAKKSSAKAFVNGVLRTLIRENTQPVYADESDRLSVETSHPLWLLDKWTGQFGREAGIDIAIANNQQPPTAFRLLTVDPDLRVNVEGWAARSEYVDGCYIASRSDSRLMELSMEARIYLQDEASQMVASSIKLSKGARFLDVCASPGGKTGLVARNNPFASTTAGDITATRTELLKQNLERQGIKVKGIARYDAARDLPFAAGSFDQVLVDSPCSGTGTIRHNPEIRYFLSEKDFTAFADKQLAILISASEMVRPGGCITYSTCSLELEENEHIAGRFLEETSSFYGEPADLPPRFLTNDGFARTWPHRDNMDGFFVARFRRRP